MVDIHTHILTNIDNGCIDYNDAGKVILEARSQGVKSIILTPHEDVFSKYTAKEITDKFRRFSQVFKKYEVELYLGAEVTYSKDALIKIFYKSLLPMNDTNIALIDFSSSKDEIDLYRIVKEYRTHNIGIIIAHVERLELSIKEIKVLKNAGAYMQVDASTIFDKKYEKWLKEMLKERLIDFISSNIHSSKEKYLMEDAFKEVSKKTNKDYADLIFNRNAKNILKIGK